MDSKVTLDRREFLFGSAGVVFVFSLPLSSSRAAFAEDREAATVSAWVKIASDNTITIMSPASELGQGSMTSVPVIFAEELDANWDDVKIEFSPLDDNIFHNPIWWAWGIMLTLGSSAIAGYYDSVRLYGAQARKLLMLAAAAKWNVPLAELSTEPSTVLHATSGRRLSYGEIASFMKKPSRIPEVSEEELKPRSEFRLIGSNLPRYDIPMKVTGQPIFSIDVDLPGMLYATVKRSPVRGAKPVKFNNEREIAGQKSIVKLVVLDDAVAVVASTYEAAYKAEKQLDVEWSRVDKLRDYDQNKGLANHSQAVRDVNLKGLPWQNEGDAPGVIAKAAKIYEAEYSTEYLYHAQLEPLNSVSHFKGDEVEIWAGTQAPTHLLRTVSELLAMPVEKIKIHRSYLGGAFGRRGAQDHDYVADSVLLSKQLGKPVKVIWSREEDFRACRVKPITCQYLRAAEDENGKLVAWSHRTASDEPHKQADPYRYEKNKAYPVISGYGIDTAYDFDNILCEVVDRDVGVRIAPMRGIGATLNKFASECFIDEIAASKKVDPVALRLELLHRDPAAQHVVKKVADMAHWSTPRRGKDLGIAFGIIDEAIFGIVAQVSCDTSTGKVRVHKVWTAVDVGLAVHPKNIEGQLEGGIIFTLSNVLKERITFHKGAVEQTNFHQYDLLRIDEVPEIEMTLIERKDAKPTGMADNGAVVLAAAIGNSLAAVTGKRLRKLPFTPDNVLAALSTG